MTDEHKMAMMHMVEHHIGRRCLGGRRTIIKGLFAGCC